MYYLSQEEKAIPFDENVHTRAKLMEVFEDMEIDYTTIFIQWKHFYDRHSKDPTQIGDVKQHISIRMEEQTEQSDGDVAKKHGLSSEFIKSWMAKYDTDTEI